MTSNQRNFFMMEVLIALLLSFNIPNILAVPQLGELTNHSVDLKSIFDKFDEIMKSTNLVVRKDSSATFLLELDPRIPIICPSVDELRGIKNVLVHHEDHFSEFKELSVHFSLSCSELDKLSTGIWKLKNDFHVLIHEQILSSKYVTLKFNYETKILQFLKHLDDIKQTAPSEHLADIDSVRNELQSQQNQILGILRKLELEQKSMNDDNAVFVISLVQQGQLGDAKAKFVSITDQEIEIRKIVASAYANNEENFKKVIAFIGLITSSTIRINAYEALHEQLKKNNHLRSENIWILAATMKKITEPTGGLNEAVTADVKDIARNNDFDGIIGYLNKADIGDLETVTGLAPLFIQTIYEEKVGKLNKVLNILQKITSIRHRFVLLNELITMLKSKDLMQGKEMPLLLIEFIKLKTLSKGQDKYLQNTVEKNLPEELHDLMYKNLCIQNVENYEYLFASSPADKERRHMYTAKTTALDDSFLWQIRFVANGTKVLIKNLKYKENIYLMDEETNGDDHIHVLRSWMSGSLRGDKQAEFTLDMIGNGHFLIVNEHYKQLLYSPFDGERNENSNRPVFSKKYNRDNLLIDSKWKIGLCRVDVEYVF